VLRAATVIEDEAEIAWELFLSLHAVRERLARQEAKLGVRTAAEAVARALRESAQRPTPDPAGRPADRPQMPQDRGELEEPPYLSRAMVEPETPSRRTAAPHPRRARSGRSKDPPPTQRQTGPTADPVRLGVGCLDMRTASAYHRSSAGTWAAGPASEPSYAPGRARASALRKPAVGQLAGAPDASVASLWDWRSGAIRTTSQARPSRHTAAARDPRA
jgi:hypothetical protein